MKTGIHPDYRDVAFHDISCDYTFIAKSTMKAKETVTKDGKTYPLIKIEISSQSHPFFTGKQKLLDSAGRLEKFQKKFGWGQKKD